MKNLFFACFLAIGVLSSCGTKCDDITEFEGPDCETPINEKFIGDYDVDYTGSGAFANSSGTTVAMVSEGDGPDKVLIDVSLDLSANVLGMEQALPLVVSVQADIRDNTYYIPETTVIASVIGIDIEITFEIEGELDGDELNSILEVRGFLTGRVEMEGRK